MRVDAMSPLRPTVDTAYRNYVELLLRRHLLWMEGRNDGEELDRIEDDLSSLWEGLDDGQRQSSNGIGSDLNWARRAGAAAPMARKTEDVSDAASSTAYAIFLPNDANNFSFRRIQIAS